MLLNFLTHPNPFFYYSIAYHSLSSFTFSQTISHPLRHPSPQPPLFSPSASRPPHPIPYLVISHPLCFTSHPPSSSSPPPWLPTLVPFVLIFLTYPFIPSLPLMAHIYLAPSPQPVLFLALFFIYAPFFPSPSPPLVVCTCTTNFYPVPRPSPPPPSTVLHRPSRCLLDA